MFFSSCFLRAKKKKDKDDEAEEIEEQEQEQDMGIERCELGHTWMRRNTSRWPANKIHSLCFSPTNELTVAFCNESLDCSVELCWVDEAGHCHHFYEIPPGEIHEESTYLGHAFLIRQKYNPLQEEQEQEQEQEQERQDCNWVAAYRPMRLFSTKEQRQKDHQGRPRHLVRLSQEDVQWPSFICVPRRRIDRRNNNARYCQWTMSVQTCHAKQHQRDAIIDTTDKQYHLQDLGGGWTVHCQPGAWGQDSSTHNDSSCSTKKRFSSDLHAATRDLPPHAQDKLKRSTHFWIDKSQLYGPKSRPTVGEGMCYHPSEDWLSTVGMSANKCHGIELYQASQYANDVHLWEAGGVLLHELSHAYHHLHLPQGYDNEEVRNCFRQAMEEGLYDCVKVHGPQGPMCRAYACTDEYEYFAELSVAFLGGYGGRRPEEREGEDAYALEHNKWFPFNRTQLLYHDPRGYALMKRMWWDIADEEGKLSN